MLYVVPCHSSPVSPSALSLAMHLLMMAARLVLTVVCVFGLMTVLVSSVVMSGTPGPRHARGSLVLFLDRGSLHVLRWWVCLYVVQLVLLLPWAPLSSLCVDLCVVGCLSGPARHFMLA